MHFSSTVIFLYCLLTDQNNEKPFADHVIGKKHFAQLRTKKRSPMVSISATLQPLELTEENVEMVLIDARAELTQLFDGSLGITGQGELAEVDGPYVTIRLKGKFWHTRAMVLARLENSRDSPS